MGTVTKTMQFYLVTCFLMITLLSQGMDGKKYLIKTGDEDDVEPYITNTLIKFDPNEDAGAVIEEKIAELKGTGVDYASFYCSGQFSCGGNTINENHNFWNSFHFG